MHGARRAAAALLIALIACPSLAVSATAVGGAGGGVRNSDRPGVAATGAGAAFVAVDGDHFTLDGRLFVMKGFNYFPRDYGWTSLTSWDWAAVDRELDLAKSVGSNTIRTGLNFLHATGNTHATQPIDDHLTASPAYLTALDHLLDLIDSHGMKALVWVNDGLPSDLYRPDRFDQVGRHLESIVPRYADDPRIAAWDLHTDLDGWMLQPPPTGAFGELSWATKANMVTFLRAEAGLFRRLDAHHALGVGFSWPSSSLLVQDFTDFLMPQFLGGDHPEILTHDAIDPLAEDYGHWGLSRSDSMASIEAKVQFLTDNLHRPMPIVLSEFGLPSGAPDTTPAMQAAVYDAVCDLAFIRRRLAGALPWVLTDFVWPPKADTHVPLDAPMATAAERTFGAWDLAYRPKPAVDVIRRYFASAPTLAVLPRPDEVRLDFSKTFVPGSGDRRVLSVAVDTLDFLNSTGGRIARIDVGTPGAHPYLADGFAADEGPWGSQAGTFAWIEGESAEATLRYPFPSGAASIAVRLYNDRAGQTMTSYLGGVRATRVSIGLGWRTYRITVPRSAATAGKAFALRARLGIPINGGTITFQTRTGTEPWRDLGRVTPKAGYATSNVVFARAGTVQVRARWSGSDFYGAVTSPTLKVTVGSGGDQRG